MKYMNGLNFCLAASILSACGGGGGGGGGGADGSISEPPAVTSVASPSEPSPVTVAVDAPEATASATQEIQVPDGFTLAANYTVALDVDLESAYAQRISLSVCTDFSTEGTGPSINYDSCLLKASTSSGKFSGDLEVGNALDSLILAIGIFGESSEVDYRLWERVGSEPYVFSVR